MERIIGEFIISILEYEKVKAYAKVYCLIN